MREDSTTVRTALCHGMSTSDEEDVFATGFIKTTARLMIGIEQSNFELVQENDSFFFERDFFMIL